MRDAQRRTSGRTRMFQLVPSALPAVLLLLVGAGGHSCSGPCASCTAAGGCADGAGGCVSAHSMTDCRHNLNGTWCRAGALSSCPSTSRPRDRSVGRVIAVMAGSRRCPTAAQLRHVTHTATVWGAANLREPRFRDVCRAARAGFLRAAEQGGGDACWMQAAARPLPCANADSRYVRSVQRSGRKMLLHVGAHNLGGAGVRAVHGWPRCNASTAESLAVAVAALLREQDGWQYDGVVLDTSAVCAVGGLPADAAAVVAAVSAKAPRALVVAAVGADAPAEVPGAALTALHHHQPFTMQRLDRAVAASGRGRVVAGLCLHGSCLYGTAREAARFAAAAASRHPTFGGVMLYESWEGRALSEQLAAGPLRRFFTDVYRSSNITPPSSAALPLSNTLPACELLHSGQCGADVSEQCPRACPPVPAPPLPAAVVESRGGGDIALHFAIGVLFSAAGILAATRQSPLERCRSFFAARLPARPRHELAASCSPSAREMDRM